MNGTKLLGMVGMALLGLTAGLGCARPEMKLGVQTYTFRTYTLMETIDKVNALGVKYIEAYSAQRIAPEFGDVQFGPDAPTEALEKVEAKLEQAGIKLLAYYYHALGNDQAETEKVFEFADEMDIKIIVCEPDPAKLDWLDEMAAKYKMKIAIHNHARHPDNPAYVNWKPEEVMKMCEGHSKRIGTCADTGHWTRSGISPAEALRTYRDRLICVHLKDMDKAELDAHDVVFGQGKADMAAVMAELYRQKFDGLASIEYEENPQDNFDEVAACVKYVRTTMDELQR
jgi:sugar phosphate isomerase/epimerase